MTRVESGPAIDELCEIRSTIPTLDEVIAAAESLGPDERLRLIARLWETMPSEHWAAPSPNELIDIKRRLGDSSAVSTSPALPGILERLKILSSPDGEKLYSAPRRFDLATIFAVTAAYSLLFTGLTLLDFAPLSKALIGAFITTVGVGQALLEVRLNARASSILVGAIAMPPLLLILGLAYGATIIPLLLIASFMGVFFGSIFGYLAGVLVGGVFLVSDMLRQRYTPAFDPSPQGSAEEDNDHE